MLYDINKSYRDLTKEEKKFSERIESSDYIRFKTDKYDDEAFEAKKLERPFSVILLFLIGTLIYLPYLYGANSTGITLQQGASEPSSNVVPYLFQYALATFVGVFFCAVIIWITSNITAKENKYQKARAYNEGVNDALNAVRNFQEDE